MFINQSMQKDVVTVGKDETVLAAAKKMRQHKIRHLPVIDDQNHLLGIISDRDIRTILPTDVYRSSDENVMMKCGITEKVADIMTSGPHTISPMDTIQDALLLIQKIRVGAFPVVDENNTLLGILSVRDLLGAFINVLGIGEPGTLLCIIVEEKVGQLKRIVDAITEENISFGSILVARYWEKDKRAVFPYLLTNRVGTIKEKLEGLGFELLDPMKWVLDQDE